jgi:hypothetical protein
VELVRGEETLKRFQFKQDKAVGERLIKEARLARKKAGQLPPDEEREGLLKKASQAETTAHIDEWVNSPGLQPPK